MLIDIAHAVGGYLHDVFLGNIDLGILIGYLAQAMFAMRFVVQWIASERAGKSVVPTSFWVFSIGGGLMLLGYALTGKILCSLSAKPSVSLSIYEICNSSCVAAEQQRLRDHSLRRRQPREQTERIQFDVIVPKNPAACAVIFADKRRLRTYDPAAAPSAANP